VSLWKRGNIWWSIYYVDGIRRQESTGTSNKRLAAKFEQKLKEDAAARKFGMVETIADEKMTFGDLAARFLAGAEVKPHHIDRLKNLLPYFADTPLLQLNKGMTSDFRISRHREKTVSDATINRDLSVLRHILYWAVDQSILPSNPMTRLRLARERRVRRPVMSVQDELKLLAVAPAHLRRIIIAALDTGMRRGEILHQLWEDIDMPRKVLSVSRSKTPEGEAREIPLTQRLYGLLSENQQNTGLVFTYKDQPIRCTIKKSWARALKNAGIRHYRFHDLRHTHNTRMMEAGVMQEVRMALMGHQNQDKVHATYTHVELPVKRLAIAKLEQWVENQIQNLGGQNDSSQEERNNTNDGDTARSPGRGPVKETMEEENTSTDSPRSSRQAEGRDQRG
jgi:integrase